MQQRRRTVAESRARKGIRRLLVLLLVVGVGASGLAVLRSSLFSLETITVAGAVVSDPEAAALDAGAVPGTPLIELDLDAVEAALAAQPRIETVSVSRVWPRGMRIEVSERTEVAWVDRGAGWEHLAIDGVVLATGDPGPDAPRIRAVPGEPGPVEAALRFVDALDAPLTTGMVVDARVPELVANWNGHVIRLGRATDMAEKARALAAVIADAPPEGSEITLIAPDRPAVLPPTTMGDAQDDPQDDDPADEAGSDG